MFDFEALLTFLKSLFDALMALAKKVFKFDENTDAAEGESED